MTQKPRQSSVWKTANSPTPKKAWVQKSGGKHVGVLHGQRGNASTAPVPESQTVTMDYYLKVCLFNIKINYRKIIEYCYKMI